MGSVRAGARERDRSMGATRSSPRAYIALLLTISNSIYSIKTAGLLWYLIGVLSTGEADDTADRAPAP